MNVITRASRFARAPVLGSTGRPIVPMMTERQTSLLSFLERNRYATFDDMHAFIKGDATTLRRNIRILKSETVAFIKVCDQHVEERNLRKKIAYELDRKGIDYLRAHGAIIPERRYARNFTHAALASHVTGSIEAGIKAASNAQLVTWIDILSSKSIPAATRDKELAGLPATYYVDGEIFEKVVRADSFPFGIALTHDGKPVYRFFPGIEADTGTEPIATANFERTSIFAKFKAYLSIEEDKTYRSHFGFPNFFVPFVTTSAARMKAMMGELDRITDGKGSRMILFQIARADGAAGYLFNEPWLRVGHGSVTLSA